MQRYRIDTGRYGSGYNAERDKHGDWVDGDEAEAEIARLTAERDAALAGKAEAERLAVWAATKVDCCALPAKGTRKTLRVEGPISRVRVIPTDGTDADILRALKEAMKGDRDGE